MSRYVVFGLWSMSVGASSCALDTFGLSESASTSIATSSACGDGAVEDGEACDDGNQIDQDGCQANCTRTQGVAVYGGAYAFHTCVRFFGGTQARCWGINDTAQLGYDFYGSEMSPNYAIGDSPDEAVTNYTIELPEEIAEFGINEHHSCMRTAGGAVYCWGGLGNDCLLGTENGPSDGPVPWNPAAAEECCRVDLDGDAIQLSVGRFGACAILEDQSLRCWGQNKYGEVGDGSNSCVGRSTPPAVIDVGEGVKVEQSTGGGAHTCILTTNGDVKCWGDNGSGRLGYGVLDSTNAPPEMAVPLGLEAVSVVAGFQHTCVIHQFGGVRCWGENMYGQLGRNTIIDQGGTPQTVPSDPSMDVDLGMGTVVEQVACGFGHTCARTHEGDVYCWGMNDHGQLGYGNTVHVGDGKGPTPLEAGPVPLGEPAVWIAVGSKYTCALLESGTLRCWGEGDVGQLGLGSTERIGDDMGEMPAVVPYF